MRTQRCLFIFLMSLLTSISSFAQETFFRNVYEPKDGSYVEVEALCGKLPSTGYAPIRVTLANRTLAPASVSLNFRSETSNAYNGSDGKLSMSSSFSVAAAAGTVSTVDLIVPVASCVKSGGAYGGPSCQQSLELTMFGVSSGSYTQSSNIDDDFPNILMSEPLYTPNASALDAEVARVLSSASTRYSGRSSSFAGKFTPTKMAEDWRAYSGYDQIIMTDGDWLAMTPGARAAVLRWNRLGGELQILAVNPGSTQNTLGISFDSSKGNLGVRSMGHVEIVQNKTLAIDVPAMVTAVSSPRAGVPAVYQSAYLKKDYAGTWGLQNSMGKKTFHFIFFILIMIAYGVLVAPVNLFVFAKSGMRHKLFTTTPIIAIGASIAMIGLIFLQDGMGGKGVRSQLMEVSSEDGDNNVYIYQEQVSRAGVLMGNRIHMNDACVITPLPLAQSQWTRLSPESKTDQNYTINADDKGMQVSGDWFQSRSEQAQLLRAIIPSRARIEELPTGESPALLSYFEYEIDTLYIRGTGGKFWKAEHIASGKNFLCSETTASDYDSFVNVQAGLLGNTNKARLKALSERENHFVAVSKSAPMMETFTSIRWNENTGIITGDIRKAEKP
jgi:hypothetical protein